MNMKKRKRKEAIKNISNNRRNMEDGGWFYMHNEIIDDIGKHIKPIGLAIYVSLSRHADKNHSCFPSQKLIAQEIGASEKTVKKYIKLLKKYNIITVEQNKNNTGKFMHNVYILTNKSVWKCPREIRKTVDSRVNKVINREEVGSITAGSELPTNNTNTNKTNINKSSLSIDKECEKQFKQGNSESNDWSFVGEINKIKENYNQHGKNRNQAIVAHYLFDGKGMDFRDRNLYVQYFRRCLAPAKLLMSYDDQEIKRVINYCKKKYDDNWTLETVAKKAPEVIKKNNSIW